MTSLRHLQQLFLQALTNPPTLEDSFLHFIRNDKPLAANERLNIYRDSMIASLISALIETYPVCTQLVGNDFFNTLAQTYIQQSPSISPNLMHYGETFADFIAQFKPAQTLPYLADIARLEWAWQKAFCGADNTPLDTKTLSQMDEENYSGIIFELPEDCSLISSSYPILHIWQNNQKGYTNADIIHLNEGQDQLIVWRQNLDMQIDKLSPQEWTLLNLINNKMQFADLCETATTKYAIDMTATLPCIVKKGWISRWGHPQSDLNK